MMPTISATQSLMSALRLKLGCMSSISPPKAEAPIKTGSRPKRPVWANGNASVAKAMKCTILSLTSGEGGASNGRASRLSARASLSV